MRYWLAFAALALIAAICSRRRDEPGPEPKDVGRRKLSMCIDANVYSATWGQEVECDLEDYESEPGGRTSAWGPTVDPLGAASTMITYDKR